MSLAADLSGRHALVTGASSGLGAHFAEVLARSGAAVTLTARRADRLEANVEAIREAGGTARALAMDVADAVSVADGFAAAVADGGPLHILVNNAGVSGRMPALEASVEDWNHVLGTNLTGAWFAAQAAARHMAETGGGSIINIASILGERVSPGLAPYAISKAGVVQMTKALALELARHQIRVNALAPGYIKTDLNSAFFETEAGAALVKRIPQRRLGQTDDLDGPLLLLACDASAFMTGSIVAVDGGHLVNTL